MKKLILSVLVGLLIPTVLSFFVYPESDKVYEGFLLGWWAPCIHGTCFIPNYIHSMIEEGRLFKATSYSTAYNVWWWLTAVSGVYTIIFKPVYVFFKPND
jgi:hypothetical protein